MDTRGPSKVTQIRTQQERDMAARADTVIGYILCVLIGSAFTAIGFLVAM